jgi:hypothetical protein
VRFGDGAFTLLGVAFDFDGRITRPTSATFVILDLRYGEDDTNRVVQASTAATVDAVSTTTSGASGGSQANRALVQVADETGVTADGRYLLTDATTGHRTMVGVANLVGKKVYLKEPLTRDYATGSTFEGIDVSATFPAAEANDEDRLDNGGGPYAIDWTWVGVNPTTQRDITYVKRNPEFQWRVTLNECANVSPSLAKQLVNTDNAAEHFLEQAHHDYYAELAAIGRDPANFYGGPNHDEYIKYRWAMHGHRYLPGGSDGYHARLAGEFERRALILLHTFTSPGNNPVDTVIVDSDEDSAEPGTSTGQPKMFGMT